MTPFVAAAGASLLRRTVPYLVAAVAVLALVGYVAWLRSGWSEAQAAADRAAERVDAAEIEVRRARDELDAYQANAEASERLVAEDILRVREDRQRAMRLLEKYRHEPRPVPPECDFVLDSVRDGARIVRDLRAGAGRESASPSAPGPSSGVR